MHLNLDFYMKYFSVLHVPSEIQQYAYYTKMLLKSRHLKLSEDLSADVNEASVAIAFSV